MTEQHKNLLLPFFAILSISLACFLLIVVLVGATGVRESIVFASPASHVLDDSPFLFAAAKPKIPPANTSTGSKRTSSSSSSSKSSTAKKSVQQALAVKTRISGKVLVNGLPAAADTVVTLVDAGNAGKVIAKTTLTGTDGSFDFGNLARGTYKLKCVLPGNDHAVWFVDGQTGGDFATATVLKGAISVTFEIQPEGAHVTGLVHRPDGSPVSGVTVVAKRESLLTLGEQYEARTQSDGTFCFGLDPGCGGTSLAGTPLPADRYLLCAEDTDAHGTKYGEYCAAAPLTAEWYGSLSGQNLEVPQDFGWPIEVSGRVTMSGGGASGGAAGGAAGGAVGGATVDVKPEAGGTTLTVIADAAGNYKVDGPQGLKTGNYTVCARDKDSNSQCYSGGTAGLVSVTSHSATANINIVITPAPVAVDTVGAGSGAGGVVAPVPASVPPTGAAAAPTAAGGAASSGAGQPGTAGAGAGAGETTLPASPGSGSTEPAPGSSTSGSSSGSSTPSTPAPTDAPATVAVIPPNVKVTS